MARRDQETSRNVLIDWVDGLGVRTKIDIILNMRLLLAMIPMLPMTVFAVTVGPLQAGRLEVR